MERLPASPNVDSERQLMIKTKVCQRLIKEVEYYKDEVRLNEMKLHEIKCDSSKDKYDIKRYEEILKESCIMVPDSLKRLKVAKDDLASYMICNDSLLDREGSWYKVAQAILLHVNGSDKSDVPNSVTPVLETCVDDLADGEDF